MRPSIYITCFLSFCCLILQAQNPYFSQFYANRVYLNPAYAGLEQGITTTINHRNQWVNLPDGQGAWGNSFETTNVTVEYQFPCFPTSSENFRLGSAFSLFRDQTGTAPFTTQGGALALSGEIPLSEKGYNRLDLRIGGQFAYLQRSLGGNYFIYSNQLDPLNGLISDPRTLNLQSEWYPNINAGLMLRGYMRKSRFSDFLWTVGATISNANQPTANMVMASNFQVLRRLTLHGGFTVRIPNRTKQRVAKVYLSPQVRYEIEQDFRLLTAGAYFLAEHYYFGSFYQSNLGAEQSQLAVHTNKLNLLFGFDLHSDKAWGRYWSRRIRKNAVIIGLSYDINIGGLPYGASGGTFEVSARFNISSRENVKSINGCRAGRFELYNGKCPVQF